jgi:dynein heavy chain
MADQLREIVRNTATDFVNLFGVDELSMNNGNENSKSIRFMIKMILDDSKIRLEPSVIEIQNVVEKLLDQIFLSCDKIPKVETQLFSTGQTALNSRSIPNPVKPDQYISVAFEETYPAFVAETKSRLKKLLGKHLEKPIIYLAEFDVHKALIARASDVDVTEFLSSEKSQDSMMEEIKKYRNLASNKIIAAYPYIVDFPLVELNCCDFINSLADRAVGLANRIVDRMGISYRESSEKIIQQFETIEKKILSVPSNVDEMCSLQTYVDYCRNVHMKNLEEQVDEAKKWLNFMITYSELKKEDYEINSILFSWPQKIGPIFTDGENNLIQSRVLNNEELKSRREKLQIELEGYSKQMEEYQTFGEYSEIHKYLKTAQRLQSKLENIGEKITNFNREETLIGWDLTKFPGLQSTIDLLAPFLTLYQISVDFQKFYQSWMSGPFLGLNAETVEAEVTSMWRNIYKICLAFDTQQVPLDLAKITKEQIEKFKVHLPLISTLCNPGLRERHWRDISQIVGFRFQPDESTSLTSVIEKNFSNFMEDLEQISAVATKEYSFEKALKKMYSEWTEVEFITLEYRDTGTRILGGVDDIQTLLDDHIVKIQTMRGSPFIKAFEEEAQDWDSKLILIQEILDEWLKVQATWLYLEPIFSSEDIMRQMPAEGKRFVSVNKTWKDIMLYTVQDPHVLAVCEMPAILQLLRNSNQELELIQKGLNQYLEVKRLYFPRFFFLSNDEMLEILSETRDPTRVQPHLKKCFEAVNSLEFTSSMDITGIYSSSKEFINFTRTVSTNDAAGAVEKWLLEVEKTMISSIDRVIIQGYEAYAENQREDWVVNWPGQVVLCVSQIYWTREVEEAISSNQANSLKNYEELSSRRLSDVVALVRGNLSKINRSTLEALVVVIF